MKIWLAGVPGGGRPGDCKRENELAGFEWDRLHSYYHLKSSGGQMKPAPAVDLFLDSGAFSAFTQGVEINLDEYCAFIKEHKKHLTVYANLDVIGDPAGTWANQKEMEKQGLNPLPCFHYGEDPKWLIRYLKAGYEYIALGGMVPISTKDLSSWLDKIFGEYLCDADGMPKVKVHGFGLTSLRLMLRYPWFSVDSTSWVVTGRMGSVYVPKMRNGKYIYGEDSWKIVVSTRSPSKKEAGKHIDTLSRMEKRVVLDYFEEKGYRLGESSFRSVSEKYELQDGEKWNGKAANGQREVETIIEPGLCNDYKLRDELNIIYFLDLEKSMEKWPVPFKIKPGRGLGIGG